jgi:hypothetical protein
VHFDGDAKPAETRHDFVAGRSDVVRMFAAKGRKALDQSPGLVEGNIGEGCLKVRGQHSEGENGKTGSGRRKVRWQMVVAANDGQVV